MQSLNLLTAGLLVAAGLLDIAQAHSYLNVMKKADGTACSYPRGNKRWWGMCGTAHGCKGPCDSLRAEAPINSVYWTPCKVERGEEVQVCWKRNNHPGGFVKISLSPFEQSDDWGSFRKNIAKFSCYETNCGGTEEHHKFGRYAGPDNGNTECCTTVRIPTNLDGKTTLQWIWFGGGVVYAQPECGFGEYMGCTDFIVEGGDRYEPDHVVRPEFQGGDVYDPNSNTCRYWTSNKQGDCMFGDQAPAAGQDTLEPCVGHRGKCTGIKQGVPYEIEHNLCYAEQAYQPEAHGYIDMSDDEKDPGYYAPAPATVEEDDDDDDVDDEHYAPPAEVEDEEEEEEEDVIVPENEYTTPAPVYHIKSVLDPSQNKHKQLRCHIVKRKKVHAIHPEL